MKDTFDTETFLKSPKEEQMRMFFEDVLELKLWPCHHRLLNEINKDSIFVTKRVLTLVDYMRATKEAQDRLEKEFNESREIKGIGNS